MKLRLMSGLLALIAGLLLPLRASACDCPSFGPPCKAFANSPTVLSGRVTKIALIGPKTTPAFPFEARLISFAVQHVYRGAPAKTVEVWTGMGGGDCGYDFHEGVDYLVYALPDRGKLYTGICQRTRPLSEAQDDLEYLGAKDDPAHQSGIEGEILELRRYADNRTEVAGPLPQITLRVEGRKGHRTTVSQKDGRFNLWGLAPGRYQVIPAFPAQFVPMDQTVTVGLHACEDIRFLATPFPNGG